MIRQANQNDIERIAQIYDELVLYEQRTVSYTGWIRGVYPTIKVPNEAVPKGTMYVYEKEQNVVASMIIDSNQADAYRDMSWKYKADDEKVFVIHTLCVSPYEKGKGIGSAMVKYAIDFARNNDFEVLRIDTGTTNTIAQGMYKKLGFEEVGKKHVIHHGVLPIELVYLEYKL